MSNADQESVMDKMLSDNESISPGSSSPVISPGDYSSKMSRYLLSSDDEDEIPSETNSPPAKKLIRQVNNAIRNEDEVQGRLFCDCGRNLGASVKILNATPFDSFARLCQTIYGEDISQHAIVEVSEEDFEVKYPDEKWSTRLEKVWSRWLAPASCAGHCSTKVVFSQNKLYCLLPLPLELHLSDEKQIPEKNRTIEFRQRHLGLCQCQRSLGAFVTVMKKPPFPAFTEIAKFLLGDQEASGTLLKVPKASVLMPSTRSECRFDPVTHQSVCKIHCESASCDASFLFCSNDSSVYYFSRQL